MSEKGFVQDWMREAAPFLAVLLFCLLLPAMALSELPQAAELGREKEMALGLREAVEMAVELLDRTGPEIARWRLKEEQGRLWPELSLRGRYSFESSQIVSRADQIFLGPGLDIQRWGADVVLGYNLLQFLESRPRIQEALAEERASILRLSHEEAERVLKASEAYFTLLSKQETLKALDVLRHEQLAFLRQQEAKFEEDLIPMIELVRAQSQLISLDREILAVRSEAASAELDLRRITGLRPGQPIILVFDPRELDFSFTKAQGLPGLLALAKDGNPRLLAANAAVEGARWRAASARSLRYPTLSLLSSYGIGHDDISNDVDFRTTDFRYSVFLTLSLPLFDGGVRRARIAQADLRAESQLREARRAEEEVKTLIEDGYWAFVEKEQERELLEQQVQLAEDELKQARARVEGGTAPTGEPLAALSRLVRLKRELARVRSEALAKGIRLALAVGRNPFVPSLPSPAPRLEAKPSLSPVSSPLATQVALKTFSLEGHPPREPASIVQHETKAAQPSEAYPAPMMPPKQGQTEAVKAVAESRSQSQAESPPTTGAKLEAKAVQPSGRLSILAELDEASPKSEGYSAPTTPLQPMRAARMLKGIRVVKVERTTMVSILADGRITQYVAFQLHQPPRFVLDLLGILEAPLREPLSVNTPQLKRVRIGRHSDKTRIVLDLAQHEFTERRVVQRDDGLQVILGEGHWRKGKHGEEIVGAADH